MAAIHCGNKFYRYDDSGRLETVRIYGNVAKAANWDPEDAEQKVAVLDGNAKRRYIPLATLLHDYRAVRPDGVMMFNIVTMNKEMKDVVVTLSRLDAANDLPYVVCRQYIYDYFSNMETAAGDADSFYMGMSVCRDTVDAAREEIPLEQTLMCAGVKSSFVVAVYLDDTLDSILRLFSNRKYNTVLAALKEGLEAGFAAQGKMVKGCCATLEELLRDNTFMADFRRCFRVVELPYPIGEDAATLAADNTRFLAEGLQADVTDVRVRRYSPDIDLGRIERNCLLAASAAEDFAAVYVVDYDKKPR